MRISSWHFNPGLWPSVAFVILLLLLLRLGFWQLERAQEKQTLNAEYQARISAEPVHLTQLGEQREQASYMYWRHCILSGEYDPQPIYLLDNRIVRGQAGYQVFSRFLLQDGAAVLVNRGWVSAPANRTQIPALPALPGAVTLSGTAGPPPVAGISLGDEPVEQMTDGIIRVQRIDIEQIAAANNWTLLPYVIHLQPSATAGLYRTRVEPGVGHEKHLGYAFQWFAMATVLLIIYLVVNTKRQPGRRRT